MFHHLVAAKIEEAKACGGGTQPYTEEAALLAEMQRLMRDLTEGKADRARVRARLKACELELREIFARSGREMLADALLHAPEPIED